MDDYSTELKIDYMIRKFLSDNGYLGNNLGVKSNPPLGKQKIINIYYDSSDGSIVAEVQA